MKGKRYWIWNNFVECQLLHTREPLVFTMESSVEGKRKVLELEYCGISSCLYCRGKGKYWLWNNFVAFQLFHTLGPLVSTMESSVEGRRKVLELEYCCISFFLYHMYDPIHVQYITKIENYHKAFTNVQSHTRTVHQCS